VGWLGEGFRVEHTGTGGGLECLVVRRAQAHHKAVSEARIGGTSQTGWALWVMLGRRGGGCLGLFAPTKYY